MIALSTFNLLVAIVILLVIYSWVDYRNGMYGNIVSAVLASLIGSSLSIMAYIGAIENDAGTQITDVFTFAVLLFISIVSAIYAILMIMEAKAEYDSTSRGDI